MSFRNAFRSFLLSSCALALFAGCAPASVDGICDDVNNPCPSGLACVAGQCAPRSCTNKVQEGAETDIDCGGLCAPCADLKKCAVAGDCSSKVCTAGRCAPAACDDGVQNGTETAVDCGGSCAPCASGQGCTSGTDCPSGTCVQNPDGGAGSVCGQCPVGQHAATDGCVPNTVNSCCGTGCATCVNPANGTSSCSNATGAFSCSFVCGAGFHDNGQGGCAVDTNTASCGSPPVDCSTQTPPLHAAEVCSGGACGYLCATGFHDVGASAGANACATDNQVNKCGSTDVDCTQNPPANTAPQCSPNPAGTDFVCDYSHCASGFHMDTNGVCAASNTTTCCGASCGACTAAPFHSSAACVGTAPDFADFQCKFACDPGFHVNAGGTACDVDNTPAACGTTDVNCITAGPPSNLGSATCVPSGNDFVCHYTCADGFNLQGNACVPNNTPACCGGTGGNCTACPASPANGDEICKAGATPVANTCGVTCRDGFHVSSSGQSCDPNNTIDCCGGTGGVCNASCPTANPGSTEVCNSGATQATNSCGFFCNDGFHLPTGSGSCSANNTVACCGGTGGNCNVCPGSPSNGTEVCNPGATQATNTCGINCSAGFHLSNSLCVVDNSITACGTTDVNCNTSGPQSGLGSASCVPSGANFVCNYVCADGFHLSGNTCLANNTAACCGGTGGNCNAACPAAPANGTEICNAGTSQATNTCGISCAFNFHLSGSTCVQDTAACCGTGCNSCGTFGTCSEGSCVCNNCNGACASSGGVIRVCSNDDACHCVIGG